MISIAEPNRRLPVVIMIFCFMAVHALEMVQLIPVNIQQAWSFFSDPGNLQHITPPDMHFRVISPRSGERMYPGQIIEYSVRPLPGMTVYWMTEITHVEQERYFVDEQRQGPYSLWHHQHHFRSVEGGVEMTDMVHYKLPFWFLGDIINSLLVKRRLKDIFTYRYHQVSKLLGRQEGGQCEIDIR